MNGAYYNVDFKIEIMHSLYYDKGGSWLAT